MTINDFICINDIVSNAMFLVGNENMSDGASEGFYKGMARLAMNEISFDTYFSTLHKDYFDWNSDSRRMIEFPKGAFNLKEIYAFNGDKFSIDKSVVINPARRYKSHPSGIGYTRVRKDDNYNENYYYSVQNGMIMLSESVGGYDAIRIVFNGISGDIGSEPIVPRFMETYVMDSIKVAYYQRRKGSDRAARADWIDAKNELSESKSDVKRRIFRSDNDVRRYMEKYIGRSNY